MKKLSLLVIIAAAAILVGCGKKDNPGKKAGDGGKQAGALLAGLIVAELPGEAITPINAKPNVKVGDEVLLSGNIAGRKKPMVDGRAMFSLVGGELLMCDENCGTCPTPWDLCCETPEDILKHAATIQVVGADGKPIKASLEGYAGLKRGKKILVKGKVQQMDEHTFIINATQITFQKVPVKKPEEG